MSRRPHPSLVDLTGRLVNGCRVTFRAPNATDGSARWNAIADCGHDVVVTGTTLRTREDIGAPLYRCAICRPNKRGRKPLPLEDASHEA